MTVNNNKLQLKFIVTTLVVVTLIVISVFAIVTLENYEMTNKQLDILLDIISKNDGTIPEHKTETNEISKKVLYATRYFCVKLDSNKNVVEVNLDNIDYINQKEAEDIAKEIVSNSKNIGFFHKLANSVLINKKTSGFFSHFKYKITSVNNGKLIVFVDCGMQLHVFKNATIRSFYVTCGAIFVIFVFLIVSSRKILSPIIKSVESQKIFVTNASHEFKTPLAVIMADIDVLEMEVGEDNEWLSSIKNQTNRLNNLTKTLLALSNIQDGKATLETSKFIINEVITNEIEELKILLGNRKVNFAPKSNIVMTADKDMIKQLINILLDNAIKYTREDDEINIMVQNKGKSVKFEILNTCENAKDIDIKKLFDRFYREDKSRNQKKGYGIGLSIAQSIVDIHKGRITAGITKNGMIYFKVVI